MPLRCAASPLAASVSARPRRCLLYGITPFVLSPETSTSRLHICGFYSSARLRDEQIDSSTNHYETLKLQPGATPAEIKKSFYALSKTHHPDHNPTNPHASRRFMRISEAYSILSIPAKRATYDRDTLQLHKRAQAQAQRRPSYSSTNPAGGRPASGLSRRRSAFTGPPPSFYRSGGWGAHGAKRKAAHEGSMGSAQSSSSSSTSSSSTSSGPTNGSTSGGGETPGAGGMGAGQTPFGRGYEPSPPHFDRASHERAGKWSDRRRAQRRTYVNDHEINLDDARRSSDERSEGAMFFVIGGILGMSIIIPVALSSIWNRNGGGGDKDKKARKGRWSAPA